MVSINKKGISVVLSVCLSVTNGAKMFPKKQQGKSGKGTFKITTVVEDNYQTFVSNVAPQIMKPEMTEIIANCFEEFTKEETDGDTLSLSEIEVQEMTPVDIVNPRRRCWRVSIPFRLKKVFEDENFYPASWRFRQFFPARTNFKRLKSNTEEFSKESLLKGGN